MPLIGMGSPALPTVIEKPGIGSQLELGELDPVPQPEGAPLQQPLGRLADRVGDLVADVEIDVVDRDLEQPGQGQQPGRHLQPAAQLDHRVPGARPGRATPTPPPAARPRCRGRSAGRARTAWSLPRSRSPGVRARRTCPAAGRSGPTRPAGRCASAWRAMWDGDVPATPVRQPARRPPVLVADRDRVPEQPLGGRRHQSAKPVQLLGRGVVRRHSWRLRYARLDRRSSRVGRTAPTLRNCQWAHIR